MNPKPTIATPRRSAAGIILRKEPELKVLLGRRSDQLRFMGGHHAFPGGRISDDEPVEMIRGAEDDEHAQAIHALAREIFEETGLLPAQGKLPSAEIRDAARREIIEHEELFDPFLKEHGMHVDASDFIDAGLWITPKGSPIRFHSRYFVHEFKGEPYEKLIEGELSGLDWMTPGEARRRWRLGEIQLPAPVAYVLQQLEHFGWPDALEAMRRTTHIVPDTPGRIEYRAGINVLPLRAPALPPATHTNCVAVGEREIYIIDPATPFPDEQKNLQTQIDHLLELGGKVSAVLLTHSHPDHIGAATMVREKYGAPIWAHQITGERVDFPIDRALEHNEVISVAGDPEWRLRCLHTPGHDPGHLCFLEESTRTMLGGDMVAQQGTIIVSLDHGGDMTQYLDSLMMLLVEDYDFLLPSHGLAIENPKKKVQEYIDHRLAREDKIRKALEAGHKTTEELLASAYDDVKKEVWPLAEKSLKAHLARLQG